MLGTMMYMSKVIMEVIPNVHLLGMFVMVYTLVYRVRALIPIYVYVFINGFFAGFDLWWYPYLYIWTVLWLFTILLPKKMPPKVAGIVYPIVCCLHGVLFGILYAPAQALMYGFSLKTTMMWIASGFYFDLMHGIGNLFAGMLVLPLSVLLKKLDSGKLR